MQKGLPPKSTINTALRCGAIGTPLPVKPLLKYKKFRELIHDCYTEEEWMARFLKLSPEDQFRFRIALEPKEVGVTGGDGGPLQVQVVRFSEIQEIETECG